MPPKKYHLKFDEFLKDKGVICIETNGRSVHDRLDKHVKKYGPVHRELDKWHTPKGIRYTIDNYVNSLGTILQDTCTDYVRIAYGHVSLDYIVSKLKRKYDYNYDDLDWSEIYKRTWEYYKRNGYNKKRY